MAPCGQPVHALADLSATSEGALGVWGAACAPCCASYRALSADGLDARLPDLTDYAAYRAIAQGDVLFSTVPSRHPRTRGSRLARKGKRGVGPSA